MENSAEEKILVAAIECVEKYGFQETTNRKIAEIAGTNSAAINYYFRSKEVLIQKVMERTLANAFDWQDFAAIEAKDPLERCIAIFDHLVEGAVNYPGITRAHFYDLLMAGNYDSPVVKNLNEFVMRLGNDVLEHGAKMDRKALETACQQLTASIFFMALSPRIFADGFGLDLGDPRQRREYLTSLVGSLLK
jgi:AcrR family transcriptional regulator